MTIRPFIALLLTLAATAAAIAAETGRTTAAGRFGAVHVEGALRVDLRQVPDSAGTVIISASERAMPLVHVSNADGTLCIRFEGRGNNGPLAAEVKSIRAYCGRDITQILLTGHGFVSVDGLHTADDLTAVVTGSGAMHLGRIDCRNLTASLSGSGLISIDGLRARNASTSVAGSGTVSAAGIDATAFNCTLSGSGSARVAGHCARASMALRGSGTLDAAGLHAGDIDISVTGSGTVSYNRGANEIRIIAGKDLGGKVTNQK